MYQSTCRAVSTEQSVIVTPEGSMSTFLQRLQLAHLEGGLAEGGISTVQELLEVQGDATPDIYPDPRATIVVAMKCNQVSKK